MPLMRMQSVRGRGAALALAVLLPACLAAGCTGSRPAGVFADPDMVHYVSASTRIDFPDAQCEDGEVHAALSAMPAPYTLATSAPLEYWELTLPEAIQLAAQNSIVLRDLGAMVISSPDSVNTIHSPAIQETDPRFGVERALSAFDASWSNQMFFEKNDRAINNIFAGGGTRLLQQDLFNYTNELSKRSAFGTRMAARHQVTYDFNNSPGNNVPNLPWLTFFELEVRQPLLQGAGADFNRIAGPGATPGTYNGVLIARINTDMSLADFEAGVRDFLNDVETSYWELHYAYRNLDNTIAARDRGLETWRRVQVALETGRRGGEPAAEARAREQFFRLDADVQNALSGRVQDRARTTTFRGVGGIYHNERQLRRMLGVPINDGRLIRPVTEPTLARVRFEWEQILAESLVRRVEIRKQQWKVKRRELELTAAKNFLRPQFDVFSRYRWRGLGHDLIDPNGGGNPPFNDAFQNLFDGDFQEWQMGAELAMPIGFRQAHAAVRNAQLNLSRDVAVLEEQRREVALETSQAIAELDRAYILAQTNLNRRSAASDQLAATEALYEAAEEREKMRLLDLLLDAQRRLAESDSEYHRALVEYMLAIKQVHYAKGSLLDYNDVVLSEGAWPLWAHEVAAARERLRMASPLENQIRRGPAVSAGPSAQDWSPAESLPADGSHEPVLPAGPAEPMPPEVQIEAPPNAAPER